MNLLQLCNYRKEIGAVISAIGKLKFGQSGEFIYVCDTAQGELFGIQRDKNSSDRNLTVSGKDIINFCINSDNTSFKQHSDFCAETYIELKDEYGAAIGELASLFDQKYGRIGYVSVIEFKSPELVLVEYKDFESNFTCNGLVDIVEGSGYRLSESQ